jgi:RNA polymerase sigma factor (sigma-70 family)
MVDNNTVAVTIGQLSEPVFRLVRRIVRDRDEALDVTQDVLIRVLREQPHLRDPGKLKPYALRAAYHAALNAARNRSRRERLHQEMAADSIDHCSPDALESYERLTNRSAVVRALSDLAEKQREAVALRFFGDLSIDEIASAMRISTGSVKVHLVRALRNLRAALTPLYNKEDM